MQETTGSSTHKENLSEHTGNTGRNFSHHQQLEDYRRTTTRSKDGATNTFEDKHQTTEDPNKAQPQMWKGETAFRIKKGTKLPETLQQQFTTKTQPRSEPQWITPHVIHYNPLTRLREKTTPPLQESAAPHTTKGAAGKEFHIFQKHILEETTGTEKAHTGREYMLSLEQRFTYQSRHMTGQTPSDSYLGDRPSYNQLDEDRR